MHFPLYKTSTQRLTPAFFLTIAILFVEASRKDVGSCNCDSLPGSQVPGQEVCGSDGMKYATECLALCQGVRVADQGESACGPPFSLVQGSEPGGVIDKADLARFADAGLRYLGMRWLKPEGERFVEKVDTTVDLLLTQEGGVYGKPVVREIYMAATDLAVKGGGDKGSKTGVMSNRRLSFLSQGAIDYLQVFGDNQKDDREPVLDTQGEPWRWIGLVNPSLCTGSLVAPDKVLTAAHCLIDSKTGQLRQGIGYVPAKNGILFPYGIIDATYIRVMSCHSPTNNVGCDVGVIHLSYPIGSTTGWFDLGLNCLQKSAVLSTAGYPIDKQSGTMWSEVCGRTNVQCGNAPRLLKHTCDVLGGMSGAPLWDESRSLRGVHTGLAIGIGNVAAQITPVTYTTIQNWINQN